MDYEIDIINKLIVVSGKRNSGKSKYIEYLFSKIGDEFDGIFVISPTAKLNNEYKWIPDLYLRTFYDEQFVENIIRHQVSTIKSGNNPPNVCLILDDIIGNIDTHHNELFQILATKGRHYKITLIIIVQHMKSVLSPVIRDNLDLVFLSKNGYQNLDCLYQMISTNMQRTEFFNFIHDNTKDYSILIYDNSKADARFVSDQAILPIDEFYFDF